MLLTALYLLLAGATYQDSRSFWLVTVGLLGMCFAGSWVEYEERERHAREDKARRQGF